MGIWAWNWTYGLSRKRTINKERPKESPVSTCSHVPSGISRKEAIPYLLQGATCMYWILPLCLCLFNIGKACHCPFICSDFPIFLIFCLYGCAFVWVGSYRTQQWSGFIFGSVHRDHFSWYRQNLWGDKDQTQVDRDKFCQLRLIQDKCPTPVP